MMVKSKSPNCVGVGNTLTAAASVEDTKEPTKLAHDLKDVSIVRTDDILPTDDVEFKNLLLPDFILNGLTAANFHRPSPIQLRSIPLLRLGLDLIVQSKAGTGKTLVITLAALETVKLDSKRLQVLVLAPTREIALQTKHFISIVSSGVKVRTEVFIGGTSVREDKKNLLGCQIAIGTPGRLNSLIETGDMLLGHVRLFVLDEADKLMEESIFSQIKSISKLLPPNKQTILCSATFLHPVKNYVVKHMKEPFWVTPEEATRFQAGNIEQQKTVSNVLLGVTQFVKEVPNHSQIVKKLRYKLEEILDILTGVPFTQCMIFSNYQTRAETICHQLVSNGWPAMSVRGQDEQSHRTAALNSFKELGCRVLLTTDVMSRGVDFRGVDLVINLDIPYDSSTYLHRMGRAGRFGSQGCVITLASKGEEVENFKKLVSDIKDTTVYTLPTELNLIKQEKKQQTVFFAPSSEQGSDCSSSRQQDTESGSTRREDTILADEDAVIPDAKEECEFKNEGSVRDSFQKMKASEEFKTKGTVSEENCEKNGNFVFVPKQVETDATQILTLKVNTRKEVAVQKASTHLSQVLCAPKRELLKWQPFEELQKMLSDCTLQDEDSTHKVLSSEVAPEKKDWWPSASIVLTAANLHLQELRDASRRKTDPRENVGNEISDTSSESIVNTSMKRDYNQDTRKKSRSKLKNSSSHTRFSQKRQAADSHGATRESFNWLWDESSKLYYVWDTAAKFYHLYNPYSDQYFKWEPQLNRYFKWDSSSGIYELWNCETGCYHSNKDKNNVRSSSTLDENYANWFALWNKHLKQMSWQIYQVEYLRNMVSLHHRK